MANNDYKFYNVESPNTLLSTQTMRVLDVIGEGPISGFVNKGGAYGYDPLCSTYYDDIPVRNTDGSYNFNTSGQGYSFNYMLGNYTQTGIPGFQKIENLIPLSSNTRLANPPQGGGPYKDVVASFSSNTFPDADTFTACVRVPALMAQDNNGNTNFFDITWAVEISTNGGPFTEVFRDTIVGKCSQPYLKETYKPIKLPKPGGVSYYDWKVKIKRISENILSQKVANEIYVEAVSVQSTNLFAYPGTAVVATEMSADQFSSIPSRSYEIDGLLVKVPVGYTPVRYGWTPLTKQCDYDTANKNIGMTTQEGSELQGLAVGSVVSGPGIPAGSKIVAISSVAPWAFAIDQEPTETHVDQALTFSSLPGVPTVTPAVYPTVWNGTFQDNVWTDNPAWVFYDLLTNQNMLINGRFTQSPNTVTN
jgi:predicted phage tail protein